MKVAAILMMCFSLFAAAQQRVDNGETPKQRYTLGLQEELRFGADEDEDHYIWAGAVQVFPRENGDMWVTDPQGKRILVFDAGGKLKKEMARPGQGPDEIANGITAACPTPEGGLAVLDGQPGTLTVIKLFGEDGHYKRTINPGFSVIPQYVDFSHDMKYMGCQYVGIDGAKGLWKTNAGIFALKESGLEEIKNLSSNSRPMPNFQQGMGDPAFWEKFFTDQFKVYVAGVGLFVWNHRGQLMTADTNTYEVTIWNEDLTAPERVISRKYKPRMANEAHINGLVDNLAGAFQGNPMFGKLITKPLLKRAVDKAEFPPAKNPLLGLIPMPEGNFLAIHDADFGTRMSAVDIYNQKGQYLGTEEKGDFAFYNPGTNLAMMYFTKTHAYTAEQDEEGEYRVVRYAYKLREWQSEDH